MTEHVETKKQPIEGHLMRRVIEQGLFSIRWLLVPLYLGLVAALGMYIVHFLHEVIDMFMNFRDNSDKQNILMLFILELVDMTMISQLIVMTIQGGYAIFIHPLDWVGEEKLPQWLKHGLGTSEQKIKLGMSIIGIMLVQLLTNFIGVITEKAISQEQLFMREQMLGCVMLGTLMFCIYNKLMHPSAAHSDDHNKDNHQ